MMEDGALGGALDDFLGVLLQLNRPVAKLLRPGLERAVIRDLCSALPFPMPEEAAELYAWRDGTAGLDDLKIDETCLFPNYVFPSLKAAVEEAALLERVRECQPGETSWPAGSLPLFMDAGGCCYALDCVGSSPSVFEYVPDYGSELAFCDLRRMIVSITACYREGAYHVGPKGWLTKDDLLELSLFKKLNPDVPLWPRMLQERRDLGSGGPAPGLNLSE